MGNALIRQLIKWSQEKRSERLKVLILVGDAIFFWLVFPAVLCVISIGLDGWLHFPRIFVPESGLLNPTISVLLFSIGASLGFWATFVQYKVGKGTPAPDAPTQKLVAVGPYAFVRNPIVLGQMVAYAGFGIFFGSVSFLTIIMPLTVILHVCYLKFVEEKELEIRFGDEYRRYKEKVPMFIPKLSLKR